MHHLNLHTCPVFVQNDHWIEEAVPTVTAVNRSHFRRASFASSRRCGISETESDCVSWETACFWETMLLNFVFGICWVNFWPNLGKNCCVMCFVFVLFPGLPKQKHPRSSRTSPAQWCAPMRSSTAGWTLRTIGDGVLSVRDDLFWSG